MNDRISRRGFLLGAAGAIGATAAHGAEVPRRPLGKTGVTVPVLGFGTAPAGERRSMDDAVKLYQAAMELGVNYFDTAPKFTGYGDAQVQVGHALKGRRQDAFLVTKCWRPTGDEALRLLEANLKELQTDYADLVYAHSVGSDEMPLEAVVGKGGVMEFLGRAKRQGLCRFTGISGHNRPARFLRILEEFDVDVMMNAVNFVDRFTYGFEEKVWPTAAQKGIGLVAMKVFGGQFGSGLSNSRMPLKHHALAFRYALTRPGVACAVVGMSTIGELNRNLGWAKALKPLTSAESAEITDLGKQLAREWGPHFGAVT